MVRAISDGGARQTVAGDSETCMDSGFVGEVEPRGLSHGKMLWHLGVSQEPDV